MISISSAVCFLPLELGPWEARWLGSSRVRVWYVCQWGKNRMITTVFARGLYWGTSEFVLRDFWVSKTTGVHEKVWGCAPEALMRCKMVKSRMLESHSFEHFVIFFFKYRLLRYRVQQAIGFLSVHSRPPQVWRSHSKWWQQLRWAGRLTSGCWNLRHRKRGGSYWQQRRRKVCPSGMVWVSKEREFSQEERDFDSANSEDE